MKSILIPLFSLIGVVALVGCGESDSSSAYYPYASPAAVPGPVSQCLQYGYGPQGGCPQDNSIYGATGWQPYPAGAYGSQFVNQGFSGCQPPMVPVVMGQGSVACANRNQYPANANYAHANINPMNWTYQQGGPWGDYSAWIACSVAGTDTFGKNWGCPSGYYCEPANGNPGMQNNPYAQASGMGLCRRY